MVGCVDSMWEAWDSRRPERSQYEYTEYNLRCPMEVKKLMMLNMVSTGIPQHRNSRSDIGVGQGRVAPGIPCAPQRNSFLKRSSFRRGMASRTSSRSDMLSSRIAASSKVLTRAARWGVSERDRISKRVVRSMRMTLNR